MFVMENIRDGELYFGLSVEEIERKVKELGLKDNEWKAHLGI